MKKLKLTSQTIISLLVLDHTAQLWSEDGLLLAELPRATSGGGPENPLAFRGLLPPKATVQMILATSRLDILCQDVPRLSRGEQ